MVGPGWLCVRLHISLGVLNFERSKAVHHQPEAGDLIAQPLQMR